MSTSRDIVVKELYGGNAAAYSPDDVSVLLAATYGVEVKNGEDPDDVFVREIFDIDKRMATPPSPVPPPVTVHAEEPPVSDENPLPQPLAQAQAHEPPSDDTRLWRFRTVPSVAKLPRPVMGALSLNHLNTQSLPGPELLDTCHTPEDMLLILCQIAESVVQECPHPPPHPTLKPLGWYLNSVQSDVHKDHADALRKEQQEREAREDMLKQQHKDVLDEAAREYKTSRHASPQSSAGPDAPPHTPFGRSTRPIPEEEDIEEDERLFGSGKPPGSATPQENIETKSHASSRGRSARRTRGGVPAFQQRGSPLPGNPPPNPFPGFEPDTTRPVTPPPESQQGSATKRRRTTGTPVFNKADRPTMFEEAPTWFYQLADAVCGAASASREAMLEEQPSEYETVPWRKFAKPALKSAIDITLSRINSVRRYGRLDLETIVRHPDALAHFAQLAAIQIRTATDSAAKTWARQSAIAARTFTAKACYLFFEKFVPV